MNKRYETFEYFDSRSNQTYGYGVIIKEKNGEKKVLFNVDSEDGFWESEEKAKKDAIKYISNETK